MIEMRLCPHCGYDLVNDAPILINDFSMNGPGLPLVHKGKPIKLTFAEAGVCWALMKACPAPLKTMALAERIGSDETIDPDNIVKVIVCRIRRRLRELEIAAPILTIHGSHTYAWDPRA